MITESQIWTGRHLLTRAPFHDRPGGRLSATLNILNYVTIHGAA